MARAARILIVTAALTLAGCAGVQKTVGGWFGGESASSTQPAGTVYFAASDGLAMHGDASFSSPVVGRLALHEKVVRTRLQSGFAYVVSDQSGVAGWVDNAQLIWRLPAAAPASAPVVAPPTAPDAITPPAAADDAPPAAAPVATPVPAPTPPPAAAATAATAPPPTAAPLVAPVATPAAKGASPEIFDPF